MIESRDAPITVKVLSASTLLNTWSYVHTLPLHAEISSKLWAKPVIDVPGMYLWRTS